MPSLVFSHPLFHTLPHGTGFTALQTRQAHHPSPLSVLCPLPTPLSSRQPPGSNSFQMSSQMPLPERLSPSKRFCWMVALILWVTDSLENLMKTKKLRKMCDCLHNFASNFKGFIELLEICHIPLIQSDTHLLLQSSVPSLEQEPNSRFLSC